MGYHNQFLKCSSQLLEASKRIDDDIQQASKLIINHPGKLVVCGLENLV